KLYKYVAHEQHQPLEIPAQVDGNGVERKVGRLEKTRAKLSQGYFGEGGQIPKPTAEEYRELAGGHQPGH
ncbi:hypothetical protein P3T39_005304, partial [Kitasatospora sp. GP82]|nr:hypothetical protein [Kitasatospora sp. GP82]